MAVSLKVVDIHKTIGPRCILARINFEVAAGQAIGLFGPSGCGKTTLLRILAGLETPDSGSVTLQNHDLVSERKNVVPERRNIGMVFQDLALWPHLTARGHLEFVLSRTMRNRNVGSRAMSLLKEFGLSEHARQRPHRLSGGEQQRLAIARALADERPLLLLDEPFSHLDEPWRNRIIAMLERRKRAGVSIVIATHRPDDVQALAESVLMFASGGLARLQRLRTNEPGRGHPV